MSLRQLGDVRSSRTRSQPTVYNVWWLDYMHRIHSDMYLDVTTNGTTGLQPYISIFLSFRGPPFDFQGGGGPEFF